jgi:thiopeptide-type bacteriocin biosynthesis protein
MPALPDSEPAPVTWLADRRWLSYHLYTPGDPREALLGFVRPVVAALYAEGRIDSFFFLRYIDDGGPHLRLRLRLSADEVGPIARRLAVEADRFAALCGDSAGGER